MSIMPMRLCAGLRAFTACTLLGGWALTACSPTYDWREVHIQDAEGLVAWFPCKPQAQTRQLSWPGVAGGAVHLLSCQTDDTWWAVRHVRLQDPAQIAPTLRIWAQELRQRPGLVAQVIEADPVPGMTRQPDALALRLQPSDERAKGLAGGAMSFRYAMAWHFSHGLTVFQATIWRARSFVPVKNGEDVALTFHKGLHFPP